jgi:hypothetical protein
MRSLLLLLLVGATECGAQGSRSPASQSAEQQHSLELRGDTAVMTSAGRVSKYVRRGDTVIVRREVNGQFRYELRWLIQGDSAHLLAPNRGRLVAPASMVLTPWVLAKGELKMDSLMRRRGLSP